MPGWIVRTGSYEHRVEADSADEAEVKAFRERPPENPCILTRRQGEFAGNSTYSLTEQVLARAGLRWVRIEDEQAAVLSGEGK